MEWVEVKGKTVELAVEVAMRELGISDPTRIAVEVVQEPEKGFLGMGGRDAIVHVKPASAPPKRRRRNKNGGDRQRSSKDTRSGDNTNKSGRGGDRDNRQGERDNRQSNDRQTSQGPRPERQSNDRQQGSRTDARRGRQPAQEREVDVSVEEQAPVVEEFLRGLVDSFGLEGEVRISNDEDIIVAELIGAQTEALVGPKGSVMEAVHELTKTVLQRKTQSSARLRLDIAGYADRRRQALTIYANRLIEQLIEDGGELMLEPMSASDRKVIHDAAAAHEGVSTYSEGTAPQRYVVLVKDAGTPDSEEE